MESQRSDATQQLELDERRSTQRALMVCRVGLLHAMGTKDFCRILNISSGGCMARVYHELAVGDEVKVEMKSGQLLTGSVTWAQDRHVGVAFCEPVDVEAALSSHQITAAGYLPRLPRMEVDYRMRLRCGSRYHSGRLRDISQRGAQVQISGSLLPEDPVSFMLRDLPPVPASVRWTKGTRVGLSFHQSVPLEPLVRWIQDRRADWPAMVAPGPAPATGIAARPRRAANEIGSE